MGGANQLGDALTKATQSAGGSHRPARRGFFPPSVCSPVAASRHTPLRAWPVPRRAPRTRRAHRKTRGHHMCGIFGYAGGTAEGRADAAGLVLQGLKKLEYRGYDSWGIAVAHEAGVALQKQVGKIGEATTRLPQSATGLGHTRWAT